jgi:hypothetical protein
MLLGIDHIVLAAADPDAAAAELEGKLGLAASGGGRHEALGTFNRLIWLGDAYLELLGVFDPELARGSWLGRPTLEVLERGGGLVTWAIAVDDVDEALRWGPPSGGLEGPVDGERRRDDGRLVRWRLARPEAPSPTQPFVIEHDRGGAEWSDTDRAARAEQEHPVGGRVRLAGVEVETASPAVAAGRIRKLLAAAVEPAGRGIVRVRFGPHEARLAVPAVRTGALVDLVVDRPIRTRTGRLGDCQIRLRGTPREAGAGPHPEQPPDV